MGPLQHINIVERTQQSKKQCQIHRSCDANGFENNCWIMALATIFARVMPSGNSSNANACIYTTKHSWPTSCRILLHRPHRVLLIRSSKICWPKDMNHHFAKPTHGLHGCIFTDAEV
jgi:hypothetical protein